MVSSRPQIASHRLQAARTRRWGPRAGRLASPWPDPRTPRRGQRCAHYYALRSTVPCMDTTQLLKGVLDLAVLAVVDDEDGYGYDIVRRLRDRRPRGRRRRLGLRDAAAALRGRRPDLVRRGQRDRAAPQVLRDHARRAVPAQAADGRLDVVLHHRHRASSKEPAHEHDPHHARGPPVRPGRPGAARRTSPRRSARSWSAGSTPTSTTWSRSAASTRCPPRPTTPRELRAAAGFDPEMRPVRTRRRAALRVTGALDAAHSPVGRAGDRASPATRGAWCRRCARPGGSCGPGWPLQMVDLLWGTGAINLGLSPIPSLQGWGSPLLVVPPWSASRSAGASSGRRLPWWGRGPAGPARASTCSPSAASR